MGDRIDGGTASGASGSTPGQDRWEDLAEPAESPRTKSSFFTFWRCCGCLAAFAIGLGIAAVVVLKMGIDSTFQAQPIDMPAVEFTDAQADEIEARFLGRLEAGETVSITPAELTIIAQRGLLSGKVGPRSRFHCATTPDGLLELRLSIEMPEESDTWFTPAGRFVNLEVTGNCTIENGEIASARLSVFRIGGLVDEREISEEASKKFLEQVRDQKKINPEFSTALGKVKLFRFDGERIELAIQPDNPPTPEKPAEER